MFNMRSKKIALLVLSAITAWLVVSWTNANLFDFTNEEKTEIQELVHKLKTGEELTDEEKGIVEEAEATFGWKMNFKKWKRGVMKWLTEDEKTALASMSDEEKIEFFEIKREEKKVAMEEKKADRENHEAVIDKLIDWEELTSEEEEILEEIKAKRAERKLQKIEKEKQKEEIKMIKDKKLNWEELSEDEEMLLNELKNHSMKGKIGWTK